MVFEAFSPQARHAIVLAQELARTSYERRIRTMDLLVALSRVPGSEAIVLLASEAHELTAWFDARRQRTRVLRRRERSGHIAFSADLRRVILDAEPRGHGEVVSTTHLVEALAAVPLTSAWTWMNRHGLSSKEIAARGVGATPSEVRGAPEPRPEAQPGPEPGTEASAASPEPEAGEPDDAAEAPELPAG